jgi:hypothetical protein
MFIAGGLYRYEYWISCAERIYCDRRDLHRDHARRVYKQNHDQRLKRAIKNLQRDSDD